MLARLHMHACLTHKTPLNLLDDLDDILVLEHMRLADAPRVVLHRGAPHPAVLEVIDQCPMDLFAKHLDRRRLRPSQDDWRRVVRHLALRLSVHARHPQVLKDHVHQAVEVPLVMRRDRAVVRHSVEHVELLHGDRVDLVERIHAWHVDAIALDDINELVGRGVAVDAHVSREDAILLEDGRDRVVIQLRQFDRRGYVEAATLFF
mmetsp:Transcript_73961/g.147047  ORF Transcript_73961/g.147047 Transcript_73961/m.147047 type:complete len:205 (+) Transcript_73961:194-808(+)